jgi:hypothetical protein
MQKQNAVIIGRRQTTKGIIGYSIQHYQQADQTHKTKYGTVR